MQLCNPSTGRAAGLGIVLNADGRTFAVKYAVGTFSPNPNPSATNADPCLEGVLPSASPVSLNPDLNALPDGNQIRLEIGYNTPHKGDVTFYASDATTDTNVFSFTEYIGKGLNFTEPGEGVEADTANLSAPAINNLAGFSRVIARDNAGHWGAFTVDPNWTGVRVDATGTGLGPASSALLAPTSFGSSYPSDESTTIMAGTPTG
jgi:hypothetical protein